MMKIFQLLMMVLSIAFAKQPSHLNAIAQPPEVQHILNTTDLSEQRAWLTKLLDRVGPEHTQEYMLHSGLPFTGQSHLLVHEIGEYIYKKYGPAGLKYCKEYFLSACYHSFIIDDLADHGIDGLSHTIEQCKESGTNVLTQCAHAAGHGFLAWRDYDLLGALKMCDQLHQKSGDVPTFNCYDGVFMENFWGVHDGEPSPKRWLKASDPLYPCDDPRIPHQYLSGCWSNQASVMYVQFHGDLKKVASYCDAVQDPDLQGMCYNNFARQIHPLTNGKTDAAFALCQNATGEKWQNYCLETIASAAFSVGDHEKMPFEICSRIGESSKKECYQELSGMIWGEAGKDVSVGDELCGRIQDKTFREECGER